MFIYEMLLTGATGVALLQWLGVLLQPPRSMSRFGAMLEATTATTVAVALLVAIAINS